VQVDQAQLGAWLHRDQPAYITPIQLFQLGSTKQAVTGHRLIKTRAVAASTCAQTCGRTTNQHSTAPSKHVVYQYASQGMSVCAWRQLRVVLAAGLAAAAAQTALCSAFLAH
jgi:hypothetical protein